MSCCGKTKPIKSKKDLYVLPKEPKANLGICNACESLTWLDTEEYMNILRSGMIDEIELPISGAGVGRRMFCRIDKDWVPAKLNCPKGNW